MSTARERVRSVLRGPLVGSPRPVALVPRPGVVPARAALGDPADRIVGTSADALRIREQIRQVALYADVPTLILGEAGTGKRHVARAIHELARGDAHAELLNVHCASVRASRFDEVLLGSAATDTAGLLERAEGGTVFLDDVGELPPSGQLTLLAALEARSFQRVGTDKSRALRARFVSTTQSVNRLERSRLRPDLFYRLAGFTIIMPPLRDRMEDLPLLAAAFLSAFATTHGRGSTHISGPAFDALMEHVWPGNLRELRGVIEQAAVIARGETLGDDHIRDALATRPALSAVPTSDATRPAPTDPPFGSLEIGAGGLRAVERDVVTSAFERCGRNVSRTSRELAIPRSTLRDKLRRYGLV